MSSQTEKSISNSLEAEQHLLPHMPYLLQDLWVLGSSVDDIIDLVGSLKLSASKTTVLDLGCGKGAVIIQIAAKYGYAAIGIDAMPEFLEEARKKAGEFHVLQLCQFQEYDIREYALTKHQFDVVILASLGGIFGSFKNTIAKLRTQVRSGGYMIIDDGYLKTAKNLNRKGYQHYKNHEETIKELTAFDDRLVKEIDTTEFNKRTNQEYLSAIKKRGRELIAQDPGLQEDINAYIQVQVEECEVIDKEIVGALWVVRKKY